MRISIMTNSLIIARLTTFCISNLADQSNCVTTQPQPQVKARARARHRHKPKGLLLFMNTHTYSIYHIPGATRLLTCDEARHITQLFWKVYIFISELLLQTYFHICMYVLYTLWRKYIRVYFINKFRTLFIAWTCACVCIHMYVHECFGQEFVKYIWLCW